MNQACRLTREIGVAAAICVWLACGGPCWAASLTGRDVQIIAKSLGFLDPAPHGGTVGVVYAPDDPASRADAEAIVSMFGDGLVSGGGTITAKAVSAGALGDGAGLIAVILAAGAGERGASAAARLHGMLCVTATDDLVRSGHCIMAVHSQPRVDITINRSAAQAAGIGFTAAFSMLVHEL